MLGAGLLGDEVEEDAEAVAGEGDGEAVDEEEVEAAAGFEAALLGTEPLRAASGLPSASF